MRRESKEEALREELLELHTKVKEQELLLGSYEWREDFWYGSIPAELYGLKGMCT